MKLSVLLIRQKSGQQLTEGTQLLVMGLYRLMELSVQIHFQVMYIQLHD